MENFNGPVLIQSVVGPFSIWTEGDVIAEAPVVVRNVKFCRSPLPMLAGKSSRSHLMEPSGHVPVTSVCNGICVPLESIKAIDSLVRNDRRGRGSPAVTSSRERATPAFSVMVSGTDKSAAEREVTIKRTADIARGALKHRQVLDCGAPAPLWKMGLSL